uniref:Small ribosomal subunit protein bS18c n=1 Tax=Schizocladia ischiensis TaxID=196139 RepID=A0A7U3NQN4_9STRA|nr:ribosomal protein S18 [Schizocladia ischiensis]QOW07479.1 ribosomal protein S18 [Schizocladia ischiensis]
MALIKQRVSSISPTQKIEYKDVDLLRSFLTDQGKIRPRRSTHLTLKQQRQLSKSVKRARILGLLSFVNKNET